MSRPATTRLAIRCTVRSARDRLSPHSSPAILSSSSRSRSTWSILPVSRIQHTTNTTPSLGPALSLSPRTGGRTRRHISTAILRQKYKRPANILIVKKSNDQQTLDKAVTIIQHLKTTYPYTSIYIESRAADEFLSSSRIRIEGQSNGQSISGDGRAARNGGDLPVRIWEPPIQPSPSPSTSSSPPPPSPSSPPPSTNSTTQLPTIDLILTLGGDGTILHVSSLFDREGEEVPRVVSFSMGSLGFMSPFHIDTHEQTLASIFDDNYDITERMRLACRVGGISAGQGDAEDHGASREGERLSSIESGSGGIGVRRGMQCAPTGTGWQVMNEVALHRGRYPHLSVIDAYVNGQHLTEAVADGLILATPTGSTAYSLSSGGPIAHPELDAFLLTPIAPRSLSFRTLVLPGGGEIMLKISDKSRAPSELSIDGKEVCNLHPGQYVKIRKSEWPVPCVRRRAGSGGKGEGEGDDWVADINSLLQFNVGFKNSSLWRQHTHL